MSLARYFVTPRDPHWLVTLDGRAMGRFATRTEAVEAAIVMANLMGVMHHDADVMVEAAPGRPLELVWSYGRSETPRPRRRAPPQPEAAPAHVKQVQHGAAA